MSKDYAARRAASHDTLVASGVGLATIGGVLMGVGATENAGSHHTVWTNAWFDVGCALVACGLVLVLGAIITSWRRSRQGEELVPPEGTRPLDVGLGALLPDGPPPSPLHLALVDESWRLIYNAVWVFGLALRVTNLTDKPIILTEYYAWPESGAGLRPPLDPKVWESVNASTKRLKNEHAQEMFGSGGELTLPPHASVVGWQVGTSYVPLPNGGRPRCTFAMKDVLGNIYKLVIPSRESETYQS
jgi:hypothetical protein